MKSTFTLKESAKVFLLTMFLLIASIKTFAYDFEIDGICYRVSSEIDVSVSAMQPFFLSLCLLPLLQHY